MINIYAIVVVLVIWVTSIGTNANVIGDKDDGVGVGGLWGPGLGRGQGGDNGQRIGGD